jgi:hypothetical protein
VISPDKYIVDVTLPVAPTNSKTFKNWTLFGSGSYTQMQSVTLTGGSQHLGADTDNFFYIFEAKWNESTDPTGKYKIVYASQYNEFTGENMTITNTTITLKTTTNADFRGWKVWNTGDTMAGGTSYTPKDADAVVINGYKYILLVADWGEDLTYANNVVYASEFGTAPRMDSIRKYQYNVTRDITLYGHSGTYVLYLHDFNNEHDPMKFELMADENNRITIPQDHYGFGNYLFVGWSSFVDSNGKRVYTYVPEESVYVANLPERINLYPYYLCDGNGTKYYDGEETRLELSLDSTLSEKQVLTKGDTAVLKVRYSDHEIYDTTEGTEESYVSGVHAGSYTVYYAAEIRTPKYSGDTSHGNTATESPFYGSSTLKILKIDAYAIAPSAYLKKGDGNIIAVSDPIGLEPSDTSSGNIAVTKEDIVLIGLVPKDVESTTLCDSTETELTRIVLDGSTGKEQKTVKAKIVFTTAETPYYLQDYNLKMIDGSLVVYPSNSSIYEAEGYV